MDLKDAIKVLDYHQRWRQGIEDDMKYTPSQLTTALDLVLEQVKKINIDDVRLCLGCDTKLESTSENKYYCPNMECSCDFQ